MSTLIKNSRLFVRHYAVKASKSTVPAGQTRMSPKLKLTYFDFPARGEPSRLAMVAGKVPFEDERIGFAKFGEIKPTIPLGSVPFLTVDDSTVVVQSNAILRYVGGLAGMYPKDPLTAAIVDQIVDTIHCDFLASFFGCKSEDPAEKEAFFNDVLTTKAERYLGGCEKIMAAIPGNDKGPFVLGDKMCIADCNIAGLFQFVKLRFFAEVPADALDGFKTLKAVHDAVLSIPEVVEYYEKNPVKPMN